MPFVPGGDTLQECAFLIKAPKKLAVRVHWDFAERATREVRQRLWYWKVRSNARQLFSEIESYLEVLHHHARGAREARVSEILSSIEV